MLIIFLFAYYVAVLSVDAIDMSGKHEVDLDTNIWKVRQLLAKRIVFHFALLNNSMLYTL